MRNNFPLPLLAPLPAARVIVRTTTASQLCLCTFDYIAQAGGPITTGDLSSLGAAWDALLGTAFLNCLTSQTNLDGYTVQLLSANAVPNGQFTPAQPDPGTQAGNSLPLEMCVTIERQTGTKGQHGRGRVSIPAVPISFTTPAVSPNLLNAVGIAAYNGFNALASATLLPLAKQWMPAILTRPIAPDYLVTRGQAILALGVQTLLGTARRRKIGRGR